MDGHEVTEARRSLLSRDILFVATADEETDGWWGAESINHRYA